MRHNHEMIFAFGSHKAGLRAWGQGRNCCQVIANLQRITMYTNDDHDQLMTLAIFLSFLFLQFISHKHSTEHVCFSSLYAVDGDRTY